jgi:nicotinate dehydrogenase subunit A
MDFELNGKPARVAERPGLTLLQALRNELALNSPKFGCGQAQCGACTVLVDGEPVRSCVQPVASVADKKVTTVEGLMRDGKPGALQQAFIDEQAAQCGYCTAGILMSAHALLQRLRNPSDAQIRTELDGNLCRCVTQNRVVRAIQRAAKEA